MTQTPAWILPSPGQVLLALAEIDQLCWFIPQRLWQSIAGIWTVCPYRFSSGLVAGSFHRAKERAVSFDHLYPDDPLIVLTILFVIWFGFGMLPKVLVVILVCFFPVLINLMNGLDAVDHDQILLFKSMGAKPGAIIWMVKIPAALPSFFSGLRISATYSIMGAIVAEWMGAEKGLVIL